VATSQISIVLAGARGGETRRTEFLSPELCDAVTVEWHDPADEESLTYLAMTKNDETIHLNRRIVLADFVLPVGPLRLPSSFGYAGVWGGFFPAFADEATRQRYQTPAALDQDAADRLSEDAAEAAWLLGLLYLVQVVPGSGDSVSEILAGSVGAVAERGRQRCEQAWRRPIAERASLVVAAISGGPEQQTWENVGRALYAASQAVSADGVIALCTQVSRPPGPALRRIGGLDDYEAKQRALRKQATFDAQTAALLTNLLERNRVYLLSELEDETVEDLGLAYVADEQEIVRLSRLHESCILLGDAQNAMPSL
jgi:nickel-dependent lactate racemase